jgi:5-methylcytosine-specific restriction enzyme A
MLISLITGNSDYTYMSRVTICHKAGCSRTALPEKHYCIKHIALEDTYGKRPAPVRRQSSQWHYLYNTRRWREISRQFLKEHPICCRCGAPAQIADHIRPHRGDEELFYDPDNLQPLCWKCHSAKTLAENGYFRSPDRGR